MSDILDDRRRGLEEEYFRRQEREAIEKLRAKMSAEEKAKAEAAAALHCPKCDATLEAVVFEGIQADVCGACGGAWLDSGELEQLSKHEKGGWLSRLWKSDDGE